MTTSTEESLRPYQLSGGAYALWYDCRVLGIYGQIAVAQYLCDGKPMRTPNNQPLDEGERMIVTELARKWDVPIPGQAYG